MLGLSTGLVYESFPREQISLDLTSIDNLIGWWDFTDASSMYIDAINTTTSNSGLTNVSADGDVITLIDNKAYTQQSNTTTALGKFAKSLRGSNAEGSTVSSPIYSTGGDGGYSYACFPGGGASTGNLGFMSGNSSTKGAVATNTFSNSKIDLDDFTIFLVCRPRTTDSDHSTTLGPCLFGLHDRTLIDTDGNGTLDGSSDTRFRIEQTPDASGDHMSIVITGDGSDIETTIIDSKTQLWTVVGAGSGNSKFYKNGDTSLGVTNGDLGSNTLGYDLYGVGGMFHPYDSIFIGERKVFGSSAHGQNQCNWGGLNNDDIDGSRVNAIYEIVFYNKKLSSSDISSVEAYLKSKYNIS